MKWITRERVKVDRAACPWLIRRLIDPQAEFIFVPAHQVAAKAAELGGGSGGRASREWLATSY